MSPSRLRIETDRGVRVIRFLDRRLYDDRTVRDVSDQLLQLLAELEPGASLVLDFTGVQIASSSMLARLILLLRRVESLGGQLRLCECGEGVAQALRVTNLDRIFPVDRDRRESLEHVVAGRR
jgi:anti-sigma B factor antagonist